MPSFAPMFKAELYDPNQWADIFHRSGAKYIVLTSKHHDGYCLWPSKEANESWGRPWNAVDIGPGRDLLGELTNAVRAKGIHMGFYYSLYEWYNPLWATDRAMYVEKHMFPQFKDLVTRYKPSVIFSDGEWDMDSKDWRSEELMAWLFNESPVKDERGHRRPLGQGLPAQARRLLHHRIRRGSGQRDASLGGVPGHGALVRVQPDRGPLGL